VDLKVPIRGAEISKRRRIGQRHAAIIGGTGLVAWMGRHDFRVVP
jgi:hypothetical protein